MTTLKTNNTEDMFYNEDIKLWYDLYNQEVIFDRKSKSLNLPKAITDEISKATINEFNFDLVSKNTDLGYISKFISKNKVLLVNHLCIGGAVALKPYIEGKRVGVVIVPATNFKADFDSFGELKSCLFKSVIYEGDKVFTLVENHLYDKNNRVYRIDYTLYKAVSNGLNNDVGMGSQVPLSSCSETAKLNDFVVIEDVNRHLCVVKTLNNTIYQNVGQSAYAGAVSLINEAYKQFNRVLWEYEGGELAIQANAEYFHKVGSSNKKQNYEMPAGKERLFHLMFGASNEFSMNTFAPQLRDSSYWVGFNNILRRIEFNCGLSYGVLSDANYKEMTATEIISSKQRFYITISTIRDILKELISEIVENVGTLSSVLNNGLVDTKYTLDFDIEDGILTTTKEQIEEKLLLLTNGIITVDEFKDWYFKRVSK